MKPPIKTYGDAEQTIATLVLVGTLLIGLAVLHGHINTLL